jgi:hypothetical protein
MDPLTLALVGAGVGLAKSELVDRPREAEQRRRAAITARWSPWTGMAPNAIQSADPFGSAIETGLTGAVVGQNQQKIDNQKAKDMAELSLTGGTSPTAPYKTAEEYPLALAPMEQMQPPVAGAEQYAPPQVAQGMTMQPMQPSWLQMGPQPAPRRNLASR